MDRLFWVRALTLYAPIAAVFAAIIWRKPSSRVLTGAALGSIWNLVCLIPLANLGNKFGWFYFHQELPSFLDVPVDLWLGWGVFWGALPILFAPRHPWIGGMVVVWLDLVFMPYLEPAVLLGRTWIMGEFVGVAVCLVPGLLLATWTANDIRLVPRTTLQVILFSALVLGVIPWSVIDYRKIDMSHLANVPLLLKGLLLIPVGLPLILGASAVQEFATRGRGTPFPWDPPRRPVLTGPYAYVSNPMQLAIALALAAIALVLRDVWFAFGSAVAVIFSAGVARWHENEQLAARFGRTWFPYRSAVRSWLPRWRPASLDLSEDMAARLYFSHTCDQCRPVGTWIGRRDPLSLELIAAETSPNPLRRLTYVGRDGHREEGVAAFGRALEHVNLAWAMLGWFIRLPVLNQLIQLLVDASSGGPREIPHDSCRVPDKRGLS